MPTLSAADWLDAWEHSLALAPALRPCALLAPVLADGLEAAKRLCIGARDAGLLDLHAALFGPRMNATAICPACGERQEFDLDVGDLRQAAPVRRQSTLEWHDGAIRVSFRLPDSLDLAAIEATGTQDQAERLLLQRCCISAYAGDREIAATDLPERAVAGLAEAMAAADPQALAELVLSCPVCHHTWQEALDIGAYLQEALGYWAEQMLDQVHLLASTYGWREADILGLAPQRRARYLARILA